MNEYINKQVEQNIRQALNTMGVERTFEVIEALPLPILRFKLKDAYFRITKMQK